MSKIGRRPIALNGVHVDIQGQNISYKGPKGSGVYILPTPLKAEVKDQKSITITVDKNISLSPKEVRDINRIWGLHHALLQNKIYGSVKEFERKLKIIGLGYKAVLNGKQLTLSLGYSNKIEYEIPEGVSIAIDDKAGQNLTVKSCDPVLAGGVASEIRFFRSPEPYKGKGIRYLNEVVRLKAGKTKAG